MSIELKSAAENERLILRNLMELYLYDFSEFDLADVGQHGLYEYPYLDHYWTEPDRFPFLIRVDERLAGFVLVTRYNYLTGEREPSLGATWVLAEFFVLKKYRHQGVGGTVARQVFDRFPGAWQVAQLDRNTPASSFWRKVIGQYTAGQYQESILDNEYWCGPVQFFQSSA